MFFVIFYLNVLVLFIIILFFINNKSIQKVHGGTQVYIKNIQRIFGLGGIVSHIHMFS
jgi:hypothetical protein